MSHVDARIKNALFVETKFLKGKYIPQNFSTEMAKMVRFEVKINTAERNMSS